MITLTVDVDGACSGNPGPGGWACVFDNGRVLAGHVPATTNNRMELEAVRQALLATPQEVDILVVRTDSANVIGWLDGGWKRNDPVLAAMLDEIDTLIDGLAETSIAVTFEKVRGHVDPGNIAADRLARREAGST